MADTEIKKGLAGVVVDYTAVSKVNPDTNSLLYRGGYPVQELAAHCSFEEVAYLLWNSELPNANELAAFTAKERTGRTLDPAVKQMVDALPLTAHPMDICRTAASVMRPPPVGGGLIPRSQPDKGNRPVRRHARRRRLRPAPPARAEPGGAPQ